MKVFISWSGELSNKIGEKFRTWLPGVIQAVSPYYTPSDIEKGTRWESSLAKELEASEVGIFLVTRENLNSHWMIFEAGALAKKLDKSRVCPILFGVEHTHLPAPLRSFQTTPFLEEEMRKLILDTNKALGDRKLADSVVNKTFEMWWPDLNRDVTTILAEHDKGGDEPEPSEKDMITEILELSRLAARRADSGDLSPRAVAHIMKAIKDVHRHIKIRDEPERIMEALKEVRDPLFYMERRVRGGTTADVEEANRDLDFSVNPAPISDDDDIPF
jgi:TIR domain